jgi:hypothetical protein
MIVIHRRVSPWWSLLRAGWGPYTGAARTRLGWSLGSAGRCVTKVTLFDHKVALAYRWPIDDLAELAREAGFEEVGRMLREPCGQERHRRGHLIFT